MTERVEQGSRVGDNSERVQEREGPDDLSLVTLAAILLRQLTLVISFGVLGFCTILVIVLIAGQSYTADSTFTPNSGQGDLGGLSGVAAQFGVNLAGGSQGESTKFYAKLLESREVLLEVAHHVYESPDSGAMARVQGDLFALYDMPSVGFEAEANMLTRLREDIDVSIDREANIVTVRATAPYPFLAEAINQRLLEMVDRYNRERRMTTASAERKFVEDRLQVAHEELLTAENELLAFLSKNRNYENSPQLRFEAARIQRLVDRRQQVYVSLAQAFEKSRIEEVRNIPVVTVLDHPEGSSRPTGRRTLKVLLGALGGVVLGVVVGLLRDHVQVRVQQFPREYEALADAAAPLRRMMDGVKSRGLRGRRRR